MITKITLDMLTHDAVVVKTERFTTVDGKAYALGKPHRVEYKNSVYGRTGIEGLDQSYQDAIFALWGSTPTVTQ